MNTGKFLCWDSFAESYFWVDRSDMEKTAAIVRNMLKNDGDDIAKLFMHVICIKYAVKDPYYELIYVKRRPYLVRNKAHRAHFCNISKRKWKPRG